MKKLFLIMLSLASFAGVYAQGKKLTLPEVLGYTLEASQTARKARLEVEKGESKIDEIKARTIPQLNATGSLNYNPILQLTALPGELAGRPGETMLVAFGQKWNSGATVALSQNIFDQGLFTGLKAARSTREFYQINAELTEEQLIEQVASLYYQVMVQKHRVTVFDTTIEKNQKVHKIIEGQYQNGLAKQIDVDRVTVNISNLQSQRQQLVNNVVQLEYQLKYAMGMPIQDTLALAPVEAASIRPQELVEGDVLDVNSRTELKLLKKQEQLLAYQKESYKAEYYPTLSLNGNYGYQGLGNTFPISKGQGVNWFDYASVGLSLKVPIFNGFGTRSRIRQADVELRKMREDISQTNLSLNLQFENAKTQLKNNLVILQNQQENVKLSKRVFDNTRNNYNNGLASLTDLLDAENSFTEANNNQSAALLNYKLAELQLIKAKGNLKSLLNR
ncbi:TolC family protein [Pollutibacter soli]|uniref:TolC family protein n=1 Tax=Pollutibacter soli TaxID=3034157 RepID=UPI0030132E80